MKVFSLNKIADENFMRNYNLFLMDNIVCLDEEGSVPTECLVWRFFFNFKENYELRKSGLFLSLHLYYLSLCEKLNITPENIDITLDDKEFKVIYSNEDNEKVEVDYYMNPQIWETRFDHMDLVLDVVDENLNYIDYDYDKNYEVSYGTELEKYKEPDFQRYDYCEQSRGEFKANKFDAINRTKLFLELFKEYEIKRDKIIEKINHK